MEWPDERMLRFTKTGVSDGADTPLDTVLEFHHRGLEHRSADALKAVQADRDSGWASAGFATLPFVPCRAIPRNIAVQTRWTVDEQGNLSQRTKPRFTTDDSWDCLGLIQSRNQRVDRVRLGELNLPSARTFARGVAILKVAADAARLQVKLIARDLTSAYRQCGVNRAELFLQCYVWSDGISVDERLEFGTASAVAHFQSISSFVLAVAIRRCQGWDLLNPPTSVALRAWLRSRAALGGTHDASLVFGQIFIDDTNAASVDDAGPGFPQGRAAVHNAIIGETFREAGFPISEGKDQFGHSILSLGFAVSALTARIAYPEEKTEVLVALISALLTCSRPAPRSHVESVVGKLGHLATVALEGRPFLDAGYAMIYARLRQAGGGVTKPMFLNIAGDGKVARNFRDALRWFLAALQDGVSAPLAPQLAFPAPGSQEGAGYFFSDASRSWGIGAWTIVQSNAQGIVFLYCAQRWPAAIRQAAMLDMSLSTAVLELAGAAAGAELVCDSVGARTLVAFIDNDAALGAINAGSSGSPHVRDMLHLLWDFESTQFLATRVSTLENDWADRLSRGDEPTVLSEVAALGWTAVRVDAGSKALDAVGRLASA